MISSRQIYIRSYETALLKGLIHLDLQIGVPLEASVATIPEGTNGCWLANQDDGNAFQINIVQVFGRIATG